MCPSAKMFFLMNIMYFKASPFGLRAYKVPHLINVKQGNVPKETVQMFAAVIQS